MVFDPQWNVTVDPSRLNHPNLYNFLYQVYQSNKDEQIVINDSFIQSIISQFKAEQDDLSVESALLIYHLIDQSPFSFLYSNLHKFLVTTLTRLLSSPNTTIKLISIKGLTNFLQKPNFTCDSLVKYQLDDLFLQSLISIYCDRNVECMFESYSCLQQLINKCNKRHSERYLKQYDLFCKSFFLSSLSFGEDCKRVEFRIVLLKVAVNLVINLDISSVLYLNDFFILFDCCLQRETCEEAFRLLYKIFAFSWPILKHNMQRIIGILVEHACNCEDDWIKEHFVKSLALIIDCCNYESTRLVYQQMIEMNGKRGEHLIAWFPSDSSNC